MLRSAVATIAVHIATVSVDPNQIPVDACCTRCATATPYVVFDVLPTAATSLASAAAHMLHRSQILSKVGVEGRNGARGIPAYGPAKLSTVVRVWIEPVHELYIVVYNNVLLGVILEIALVPHSTSGGWCVVCRQRQGGRCERSQREECEECEH